MQLFNISEIDGIYADAYLTDESEKLVFLSVWGRDTALQEFIARLQLPKSENGIRDFHILGDNTRQYASIPNVDDLEKTTIKTSETIFGVLTQLWIYDRLAVKPDITNRRALMLYRTQDHKQPDVWPLVKTVCPLPLLDQWKNIFLAKCFEQQWIRILGQGSGISGLYIRLGDDVEAMVSQMVQQRELILPTSV